jgi:cytochrome c-type biogenesis protein CcmF
MKEIIYENEHLLIGNLGHFFVALSFMAAFFAAFAFFRQTNLQDHKESKIWQKAARLSFWIHSIAVIGIFVTLFYIIWNHYFEYAYAYQHSSRALPVRYMISCFWEGQEGSFLLWMFWHAVLGIMLMFSTGKWEAPVMAVLSLSQVVLASMLLGIELGEWYTVGSSPFALLRDRMIGQAPIFTQPNYMEFIVDGTGLNPLLQNYWMVIHPPTLFFGFAASIVPYAFAIAGLWKKEYQSWISAALPWALLAVMVLGAGIIMGGFWAYESLSFGGYWAWDPVENASLIPWLVIIAGTHVMLINKHTRGSGIWSYLLIIASFILVLYATFLTRSGILGDTSVHSFTDLGLAGQLLIFLFMFIALPIIPSLEKTTHKWIFSLILITVLIINVIAGHFITWLNGIIFILALVYFVYRLGKVLPKGPSEEHILSREFWMFIGSLVLLMSAFQVIITTSIPVFNKIFGSSIAPPVDVIGHYNKWQLPIAIIIALLTAGGQFFKYKKTKSAKVLKDILIALIPAILFTIGGSFLFGVSNPMLLALLFAAIFALIGNFWYIIGGLKGKLKNAGGSVAHIGFGLMLIGVLVSASKKEVISINTTVNYGDEVDPQTARENILLWKNEPYRMGDFLVTYRGDSTSAPNTYYRVDYEKLTTGETFSLFPNAQINDQKQLLPNPDTRHYPTYDVFTHVTSVPIPGDDEDEWNDVKEYKVVPGDTILTANGKVVFEGIDQNLKNEKLKDHQLFAAVLKIISTEGRTFEARPVYALTASSYYSIREEVEDAGLRFNFEIRMDEGTPAAYLEIEEKPIDREYIIMKAIVFPYINLLWGGTIIMIIGFTMAIFHRIRQKAKEREA